MAKTRVHDLAKEYGMSSKEMLVNKVAKCTSLYRGLPNVAISGMMIKMPKVSLCFGTISSPYRVNNGKSNIIYTAVIM
jgi:hypothetical protein